MSTDKKSTLVVSCLKHLLSLKSGGRDVEDTLYVAIAICGFSLQLYLKGALCSFGADILVRRQRWTWTDFIILKKRLHQ